MEKEKTTANKSHSRQKKKVRETSSYTPLKANKQGYISTSLKLPDDINRKEAAAFERFSAANLKEVKMMKPKAKKHELDSLLKNLWSVATETEKVQWYITNPATHAERKDIDLFPPSPEVKKSRKKDAAPSKKVTVAPADTFSVPTLTSMNEKLTKTVNPRVQSHASTSLLNSSISVRLITLYYTIISIHLLINLRFLYAA